MYIYNHCTARWGSEQYYHAAMLWWKDAAGALSGTGRGADTTQWLEPEWGGHPSHIGPGMQAATCLTRPAI